MVLLKELISKVDENEIEFEDAMKAAQGIKDEFLKYIDDENITQLISMEDVTRIWKNQVSALRNLYNREVKQ